MSAQETATITDAIRLMPVILTVAALLAAPVTRTVPRRRFLIGRLSQKNALARRIFGGGTADTTARH